MERSDAARLLNVRADASARQVRSAFRKLVRIHHPDRNSGRETADFQRLTEARDLLLTPVPTSTLSGSESSLSDDATGPTARTRTGTTPTTGASERASRVRTNHSRMEFGYDPSAKMPEPDSITRERNANRQANRVGKNANKGAAFRPSPAAIATAVLAVVFVVVVVLGVLGVF